MTSFHTIIDGTTTHVVFDDGGMNLLSREALAELREIVDGLAGAPGCRLVTLRSGRQRLFAAGADMEEMSEFSFLDAEELARLGQETFAAIERLPMITVALIDGDCFGGALDLVLSFDLRYVTPRSRFAHPGAKLGIVTGYGGTSRWRNVVAPAVARRLFLGNEVLPSAEAVSLGLADRSIESFDDVDGTRELDRLASIDPARSRFVKELSRYGGALSQSEMLLLARRLGAPYLR